MELKDTSEEAVKLVLRKCIITLPKVDLLGARIVSGPEIFCHICFAYFVFVKYSLESQIVNKTIFGILFCYMSGKGKLLVLYYQEIASTGRLMQKEVLLKQMMTHNLCVPFATVKL